MKKIILCFIFVFILCGSVNAAEFEVCGRLTDNYWISTKDNRYGITDNDDNIVLPFEYDSIHQHSIEYDGLLAVKKKIGDIWYTGYADSNDNFKIVIPVEYLASDYCYPYISKQTNTGYDTYVIKNKQPVYFGSSNMPVICLSEVMHDEGYWYTISNGDISWQLDENKNIVTGPIKGIFKGTDDENTIILYTFTDGKERVVLADNYGNYLTEPIYKDISKLRDTDFYKVQKGDLYGVLDKTGNAVAKVKYEYIDFANRYESEYIMCKCDDKWGLLDENYNEVTKSEYDSMAYKDGIFYAGIKHEGKTDYYKIENGEETFCKSLSGDIYRMSNGEFGYRIKQSDNNGSLTEQYGLVDTDLGIIIKPKYDNEVLFDEYGYAVVYKNSSCGVIDRKGRTVLNIKYESITPDLCGSYLCRTKKGQDKHIDLKIWGELFVIFHLVKKLLALFIVWLIYAFVKKRKSLKLMRSTV